jgi:hypothetical protein
MHNTRRNNAVQKDEVKKLTDNAKARTDKLFNAIVL